MHVSPECEPYTLATNLGLLHQSILMNEVKTSCSCRTSVSGPQHPKNTSSQELIERIGTNVCDAAESCGSGHQYGAVVNAPGALHVVRRCGEALSKQMQFICPIVRDACHIDCQFNAVQLVCYLLVQQATACLAGVQGSPRMLGQVC
jgi:hypothetical protein